MNNNITSTPHASVRVLTNRNTTMNRVHGDTNRSEVKRKKVSRKPSGANN